MNIEAFLLCDAATDTNGKLNVLGAFDRIFSEKMPVIYPSCSVAARIRFSKIEEGSHDVRISIIDQDGKEVVPRLDGNLEVRARGAVPSAVANLILRLERLKLENYGDYRIDLAIDGKLEASLPFSVIKRPKRASSE